MLILIKTLGVVILISEKVKFKSKNITTEIKMDISMKRSICEEDKTTINVYRLYKQASQYMNKIHHGTYNRMKET